MPVQEEARASVNYFSEYRYAAISRACPSLTPRFGIATPGSIDWGTVIHVMRFAGVLGTSPAMMRRSDHDVSGGPTMPLAPVIPGIM
jgi:hypothetical protein